MTKLAMDQHNYIDQRKLSGVFVVVVIIVGTIGLAIIVDKTPTTYRYEAWLPESNPRDTRFTITGIEDANITVSFVDEPGLWYRLYVTHYDSMKRHSVENVVDPSFLPLRVQVTSITPVKSIHVVLGTDVVHSMYISGSNLNTIVIVDNGARISGSKCRFYGTGVFQFGLTENVNYTSEGMDIEVGDFFSVMPSPELVVLNIDLPAGLNGRLSSPNATFIHNDWLINYDDEWGTASISEPLIDIEIHYSMRVWANLRM